MAKLLQPQEIEVFYVIPTLRRNLALKMKAKGMKQKTIAELLRIENAAVSQYLSGKRGNKINLSAEILEEIGKTADNITDDISLLKETQKILNLIRTTGELCRIHKQLYGVPDECTTAYNECFLSGMK